MKGSLFAGIVAALTFTTVAGASSTPIAWTKKDMTTAVRALGYPKPHPKKLTCKGLGSPDSLGRYGAFHCVATYLRRPKHRSFYIEGRGEGGWLCAGARLATCKLLGRGFVTTAAISAGGINAAADVAARGYMTNRYGSYQPTGFCQTAGTLKWTCGFTTATVALTMKTAKDGYLEAATATAAS